MASVSSEAGGGGGDRLSLMPRKVCEVVVCLATGGFPLFANVSQTVALGIFYNRLLVSCVRICAVGGYLGNVGSLQLL